MKIIGLDAYELNARLRPALFVVLPPLVLAAVWLPTVWTAMGGLTTLLSACGVTFLLSRIARSQGRKLQDRLATRIGPISSVAALRHADSTVDPATKARYHAILSSHGHMLPSPREEAQDPPGADAMYRGCTSWLLEQTRDKKRFDLLAQENMDYGFRRNLWALKPIAIPVLVICLLVNGLVMASTGWHGLDTTFWKVLVVALGLTSVLSVWLAVIREAFVADASRSFSVRLLAACDVLGRQ